MIKISENNYIEVQDWDDLVRETYGKVYNFQQQNGCRDRQLFEIPVPSDYTEEAEGEGSMNENIPEHIRHEVMGVKWKAWLERDPEKQVSGFDWETRLFWERNFYPSIYTLANDLHAKGLLPAGNYIINIDW